MTATHWPSSGGYSHNVAGVNHHQEALDSLCKWPANKDSSLVGVAILKPEPSNPYDANAIAVFFSEQKIGFLPKDLASIFHGAINGDQKVDWNTTARLKITRRLIDGVKATYIARLDLNLSDPPHSKDVSRKRIANSAVVPLVGDFGLVRDGCLVLVACELDSAVVRTCFAGDSVDCWQPDGSDDVYLYAPGSIGGSGRISVTDMATLKKLGFPVLSDFDPVVHSSAGNTVILIAKIPK